MANSPIRVSVALITHNSERYLSEQIDSILMNLGPNDEIVVSDDCSTDGTLSLLKKYGEADPRIHVYTSTIHLGANGNAEKAYSLCQGEFIFHSDDDNVWKAGKVDTILRYFGINPNVTLVMAQLKERGVEVVVFEPTLKDREFNGYPLVADFADFAEESDLILANRITDELKLVQGKVYSRDLFERD